jgi:hypothetical protein
MERRLGALELRLVRLAESIFQTNLRRLQRSSTLVPPEEPLVSTYETEILEEPSLGSMSESRCSMALRVFLEEEDGFREEEWLVVMDETMISMDL